MPHFLEVTYLVSVWEGKPSPRTVTFHNPTLVLKLLQHYEAVGQYAQVEVVTRYTLDEALPLVVAAAQAYEKEVNLLNQTNE